jgi:hypothetical protein
MTPAQRQAQIEAAKALLSAVEADEVATPQQSQAAEIITSAPATIAARSTARTQQAIGIGLLAAKPAPIAPVTGPGGDTRKSGVPSLSETMKQVWRIMKGTGQ